MRKFLATLLVLVFLPIFVFVFLSFNLQSLLFDKETVKQSLNKVNFYERLVPAATKDATNLNKEISDASDEEILQFVNKTLPPETLKMEVEKTIDVIYPYLLSETDSLHLEYSLKDYKKTFQLEAENFIKKEIEKLPKCTKKELEGMNLDSSESLPECKPTGTDKELFNGWSKNISEMLATDIPDKIIVNKEEIKIEPSTIETEFKESPKEMLENIRKPITQIPTALKAGFVILLALLILIALLRWGSYRSMAKWIGWTLLLSTIISTIFSLSIYSLSASFKGSFDFLGDSAVLAVDLTSNLLGKMIFSKVIPQAIVIVIISLALIIIPYLIKPKKEPEVTT